MFLSSFEEVGFEQTMLPPVAEMGIVKRVDIVEVWVYRWWLH